MPKSLFILDQLENKLGESIGTITECFPRKVVINGVFAFEEAGHWHSVKIIDNIPVEIEDIQIKG